MQDPDASSVPGGGGVENELTREARLASGLADAQAQAGAGVWTSVLGRPRAPSANGAGTRPEAGISPQPAARSELRRGHCRDPA